MTVGMSNVWRFPYTAYKNGGGAFIIPYLIVLIFVGKPLYFMELALGQFSSYGPVKIWYCVPILKGISHHKKEMHFKRKALYKCVDWVAIQESDTRRHWPPGW